MISSKLGIEAEEHLSKNAIVAAVLKEYPQININSSVEKTKFEHVINVHYSLRKNMQEYMGFRFEGFEKGFWQWVKRIWHSINLNENKIMNTLKIKHEYITPVVDQIETKTFGASYYGKNIYVTIGYYPKTDTIYVCE